MGFDSLFTGISGLDAFQNQIDMISNNIANVGTTGFKGQRMTFADLFYQSQGFASAPSQTRGGVNPQEVGLGVKVNTIDTDFSQSGFDTTNIKTDLALNGDGFFILNNVDGSGIPIYTRDGAFSTNVNGLLYDPSTGLAVQGWTANANGTVSNNTAPGSITIPVGMSVQASATGGPNAVKLGPANDKNFDVAFTGQLDQTQYAAEAAAAGTGVSKSITTTIYDSLGNPHQATVTFKPVGPATLVGGPPPAAAGALPATVTNPTGTGIVPATRWQYSVTFADGTTTAAAASSGYIFFDANGQFINTAQNPNGAGVHTIGTAAAAAQGNAFQVASWAAGNNSTAPQTVGLDFSTMVSLQGGYTAAVSNQDGFAPGTLKDFTVGTDGTITGAFSNGQQRVIGQVAVATFQNEGGLHRVGGNGFQQTANSGTAQIGAAGTGRLGVIVSGALEQSNVSLASEFTKMIVAQRAFEANTRGITTGDQDLQTVINIRASEN